MQNSDALRREKAKSYSVVIVREGGRSSITQASVMESIGRGVLDTAPPASAGYDGVVCGDPSTSLQSRQHECHHPSSTASAPLTASALSITVRSSDPACTEMFSAKNSASVT